MKTRATIDSRTAAIVRQREAERHPPVHITSPERAAELAAIRRSCPSNATGAQQARIQRALGGGGLTTIEARDLLGVMSPAQRIHALSRAGVNVQMSLVQQSDSFGAVHRVAMYELIAEAAE